MMANKIILRKTNITPLLNLRGCISATDSPINKVKQKNEVKKPDCKKTTQLKKKKNNL